MTQHWQFGTRSDGRLIHAYRLRSDAGYAAVILNQGAILQSFFLPNGRNVTLGFDEWNSYESDTNYKGRIIGPNANRIANARFKIDDREHRLTANDGLHNLHSGPTGFDGEIWDAALTDRGLELKLDCPQARHGFPGKIRAALNISLIGNTLRFEMEATSNRPTPMNLTWHPYWNLSGETRIDGHDLEVNANLHTMMATPKTLPVSDTFRDFTSPRPLGSVRLDCSYDQVKSARLTAGQTAMTVTSSLPCLQVYTGDALPQSRAGIALEPQFRPNDINFAQDSLLRPGEIYRHWIEYRFDDI